MGYADGYYYGQGRIICDTSTFSVGDTIRVRSMTDSSKVWNKTVATVGTALVFTVPCYDYYKICTVQTINDTPTEIGGVYKTVDYGQTLFIDVIDKTTLGGIQGILNAHQTDLLTIGDEVNVSVGGVAEKAILLAKNLYDTYEAIFCFKNITDSNYPTVGTSTYYYQRTQVLNYLTSVYSSIDNIDRQYLKDKIVNPKGGLSVTQKVWIPTRQEVTGDVSAEAELGNLQFPYFVTQSNRIKYKKGGTAGEWQLASSYVSAADYAEYISTTGTNGNTRSAVPILPCFRLTADS